MTLLEQLQSAVNPQIAGYAAKMLGESPANVETAIDAGFATILAALATAAHVPAGQSGHSAASRIVTDPVNDGTLAHRLPALYQGTMTASPIYRLGAQFLQVLFGSRLGKVTQTIAAQAGIKSSSASLLFGALAPHVLAVVGKQLRKGSDGTAAGLATLMDGERNALKAALPAELRAFIAEPVAGPAAPAAAKAAVASAHAAHHGGGDQWTAAIPLALIALLSVGLGGLFYTATHDGRLPGWPFLADDDQPAASISAASEARAPAKVPQAVKTVDATKAADAGKPAPSVGTTTYFGSTPTPPAKPAERNPDYKPQAKPAPAASAANKPAAPAAKTEVAAVSPTAPAKPAAPVAPAQPAKASPWISLPGNTTYFGSSPVPAEQPARMNPDYRPAPAIAVTTPAAKPDVASAGQVGTTSYYGASPSPAEQTAKANPDYKPGKTEPSYGSHGVATIGPGKLAPAAATAYADASGKDLPAAPQPAAPSSPAVAAAASAIADAASKLPLDKPVAGPAVAPAPAPASPSTPGRPIPVPVAGTTSYYGSQPASAEQPARPNPDYKPAPPVQQAQPAQQAAAAERPVGPPLPPPRPFKPAPGVTTYFGTKPAPAEQAAKANPDYKPSTLSADGAGQAAPVAADLVACERNLKQVLRGGAVTFASAKADIAGPGLKLLDRAAAVVGACAADIMLTVEGHTDSSGNADANMTLSQARAQAVVDHLTRKGLDAGHIKAVGLGATKPVAPNTSAANKARNRRIEMVLSKG